MFNRPVHLDLASVLEAVTKAPVEVRGGKEPVAEAGASCFLHHLTIPPGPLLAIPVKAWGYNVPVGFGSLGYTGLLGTGSRL